MTETREPVLYEQATLDIVTNPTLPSAAEVPVGVSRQQAQVDFNIYSVLWFAGMAALLVHALVSAGKLKESSQRRFCCEITSTRANLSIRRLSSAW